MTPPTVLNCTRSAGIWLFAMTVAAGAGELVSFSFVEGLAPTQAAPGVTQVTGLYAWLSGTSWDSGSQSAGANGWKLSTPTNYFRFAFFVEPGFVADIDRVEFDYKSQQILSVARGPNQYNVLLADNGDALASFSEGWQALTVDNAWHAGVAATNAGAAVTGLRGHVTFALAANGANDDSLDLSIDNLRVFGAIRPDPDRPDAPALLDVAPQQLRFGGVQTQIFYSVRQSDDVRGPWRILEELSNLQPPAPSAVVALPGGASTPTFLRVLASRSRAPSADLSGFWSVSSITPNSFFQQGVMRLAQEEGDIRFEAGVLGRAEDASFIMRENGTTLMDGALSPGGQLHGSFHFIVSGSTVTGSYDAVRYAAPKYEIWQDSAALSTTRLYDPGANGYTKVGQADGTATFSLSAPYVVIAANTLAPIDAITGSDGRSLKLGVVLSISSGNTYQSALLQNDPDGRPALVGNGFSGRAHRGYIAFSPNPWSSITVHVVPEP